MDLAYETQGTGFPIVMIHSPGVDSREWKYVAPRLAERYQVITVDVRGVGRSPAPLEPLNLVDDLRLLFEHLAITQAALVGHSMGGQAATDFALCYPSWVNQLILIAPSLTGFNYSQEFVDWMNTVNAAAPDIDKMLSISLQGPNYKVVAAGAQREFLLAMQRKYMTRVFSEWKSFEVIWPQPPAIERLESMAAKTLFIQGTVEWADIAAIAEQFARVPDIRFAKIQGADHMIPLTHPQELAALISDFVSER